MVERELMELIQQIQTRGCEEQTTEVKSARGGCPEKLYDTISAFSNQNSGGVFVFGLDEKAGFRKLGVYDAQDLQKKVMEYCEQMTPIVRPVFTVYDEDGMVFVSAEIPPVDIADRPCFKTAKGRLQGSYIRVGDADKPMTCTAMKRSGGSTGTIFARRKEFRSSRWMRRRWKSIWRRNAANGRIWRCCRLSSNMN